MCSCVGVPVYVYRCVCADLCVQLYTCSGNAVGMFACRFWWAVVEASICAGIGVQMCRFRCADAGV